MKIICVGRNYVAHANELNNPVPKNPVIFMKPQTALLKGNMPFYYPALSNDIHYEVELVYRISKNGKHIAERFAHTYIDAVSVGIDFTARDLQEQQKSKGLPWEIAKAFDNSAVIGTWNTIEDFKEELTFSLFKNGEEVQRGYTSDMLFSIKQIVSYVSEFFSLQKGDIIFTGTPAGVGPIAIGDFLEASIMGVSMLECEIK
jgi:2-keto-4-pentenoate hydratase/2-oxohepta-3-ene-1,7-dioic acid hydratase in catechol pathway